MMVHEDEDDEPARLCSGYFQKPYPPEVPRLGPWTVGQRVVNLRPLGDIVAFKGAVGTVQTILDLGDGMLRLFVAYPKLYEGQPQIDYLLRVNERSTFVAPVGGWPAELET